MMHNALAATTRGGRSLPSERGGCVRVCVCAKRKRVCVCVYVKLPSPGDALTLRRVYVCVSVRVLF